MRRLILLIGVLALVAAACGGSAEPTTDARTWVDYYNMQVGSCSNMTETHPDGDGDLFVLIDCSEPHEIEFYAVLEHPAAAGEPDPSDAALNTWTVDACEALRSRPTETRHLQHLNPGQ